MVNGEQPKRTEAHPRGEAGAKVPGRNSGGVATGVEADFVSQPRTKAERRTDRLMEAVMERGNLRKAYEQVMRNKGAPGVDHIGVQEFRAHLKRHWPSIRTRVLDGSYIPHPVRRVDIPKPQGGVRTLGIPTLQDRLIQQALHQVLAPIFEPGFSQSSYGFRPGKSAHQAVKAARDYVEGGRRVVVDLDLEKFFDRVNHSVMLNKLGAVIHDERVMRLINRFLKAGMMADGVVTARTEGTPQGGPLSPLLSNILLTDLDRELERRGHKFCRYADDCNVYVGSRKAGERLKASLTRFLEEKLKLKVNESKSAVDRPWKRKFLGYSMTLHHQPRLRIAEVSLERLKNRVRMVLRKAHGRNIVRTIKELEPILRGWINYFRLTQSLKVLLALDGWIRRKLRCILWRQWKRPYTRAKNLMKRGLAVERSFRSAFNQRGPWWNSGASHMNEAFRKIWFDQHGLVSLHDRVKMLQSLS